MKTKRLVFLVLLTIVITLCSCNTDTITNVQFFRKVSRASQIDDTGWVYSFVYEDYKDGRESTIAKYSFYGLNLRYQYDDMYIQKQIISDDKGPLREITYAPPILILGEGSEAQKNDRTIIDRFLDPKKTPEELLDISAEQISFEELDEEMFLSLLNQSLQGAEHEEGKLLSYWEKPSYALLVEDTTDGGYTWQIGFLTECGCVDEVYLDLRYHIGPGYRDFVQLSDLVDNGRADVYQQELFSLLQSIRKAIIDSNSFIAFAEDYKSKSIGGIDLDRLYTFLMNIHNNDISQYIQYPVIIEERPLR